ncbi:FG-GAP repeat domain-containing protein [Photobacterium sanguinicancri]|uniref:VCBS repeat-containing protein n=1 Tax=Photobacterium sanguinicancri TaxID=875932 RepID=A0AAW7Y2D7_9GAMM|nr:VCBS repeat-containing protein [Photobacterium sanguinicancri]MDO6541468.1 VCBS repeat-containing protein [Photobacterium sanguinicancri]
MNNKKVGPWLASALISLSVAGCNSDSNENTPKKEPQATVNAQFAATYLQTIQPPALSGYSVQYDASGSTAKVMTVSKAAQDVSYQGTLRITNRATPSEHTDYEWPVTQRADGSVESHRALSLKPGVYDFFLIVADSKGHQYLAESLGQQIVDNEQPELEFVLKPNLGGTITDLDVVAYVTNLKFSFTTEELSELVEPQFGLKINDEKERVFSINKETGLSEIVLNVQPGEYTMALKLYDGDLMVGKNENETKLDIVEGSDAKMDVIPLQADVTVKLDELKDLGEFTFNIPSEIVEEVGDESKVSLIVRLSSNSTDALIHEKVLTVVSDNKGGFVASDIFETQGESAVTASLSFHHIDEAAEGYQKAPYAQCLSDINVELNQGAGCKLSLKREGIITGHIKGTVHFNIIDQQSQAASGAKVYLNNELVGITGKELSPGSLKLNLVAGEYMVKASQGNAIAKDSIEVKPLDVLNKALYLGRNPDLGTGNFVEQSQFYASSYVDPYSIATGDINGDGLVDLVFGGYRGYQVEIAQPDGSYKSTYQEILPAAYRQVALGDLDGDGDLDFVLSAEEGDVLSVYLNDGKGNFAKDTDLLPQTEDTGIYSVKVADLDNDGDLDVVALRAGASSASGRTLIYLNQGNGKFIDSQQQLMSKVNRNKISVLAIGDMNNDGHLDIVVGESGTGSKGLVYLNNGEGIFESSKVIWDGNNESSTSVVLADVNDNGKLDVFVTDEDGRNRLYLNEGDVTFNLSNSNFGTQGQRAVFSDINSNGKPDILILDANSLVTAYSNNGNGTYTLSHTVVGASDFGKTEDLHTTDLDKDGDEDLVVLGYKSETPKPVYGRIYHNTPH